MRAGEGVGWEGGARNGPGNLLDPYRRPLLPPSAGHISHWLAVCAGTQTEQLQAEEMYVSVWPTKLLKPAKIGPVHFLIWAEGIGQFV